MYEPVANKIKTIGSLKKLNNILQKITATQVSNHLVFVCTLTLLKGVLIMMKAITGVTNVYLDYKLARHVSVMQMTWQLRKEWPHRMSKTA
jgi:hypothetical protein